MKEDVMKNNINVSAFSVLSFVCLALLCAFTLLMELFGYVPDPGLNSNAAGNTIAVLIVAVLVCGAWLGSKVHFKTVFALLLVGYQIYDSYRYTHDMPITGGSRMVFDAIPVILVALLFFGPQVNQVLTKLKVVSADKS
jgi:glucan phosphoethanolaminetransferase (alkaline phosphatase superfamily)